MTVGCGSDTTPVEFVPTTLPPIANSEDAEANVTLEEAQAFATAWQKALASGSVADVNRLADTQSMAKRFVGRIGLTGSDAEEVRDTVSGLLFARVPQQIRTIIRKGGGYEFVRFVTRENQRHAIFRLTGPGGEPGYHDLRLVKLDGKTLCDQLFVMSVGETLTDSLARNGSGALIKSSKSLMDRLSGKARVKVAETEAITKMNAAYATGQYQNVLELFDELRPETQKQKLVQQCRLKASGGISDEHFSAAFSEYQKLFPNDTSMMYMNLNVAIVKESADLMMKSYEDFQEWTGGDDYLKLLFSEHLHGIGKTDEARKLFVELPPEVLIAFQSRVAHGSAVDLAIAFELHSLTLGHLQVLRDRYDLDLGDLTKIESMKHFVKSDEYKIWVQEK